MQGFTRKLVRVVVMEDGRDLRVRHHHPTRGHRAEHRRPEAVGHPPRVSPEPRVVSKPLVNRLSPEPGQVNVELRVNFVLDKDSESFARSAEADC